VISGILPSHSTWHETGYVIEEKRIHYYLYKTKIFAVSKKKKKNDDDIEA